MGQMVDAVGKIVCCAAVLIKCTVGRYNLIKRNMSDTTDVFHFL